MSKVDQYYWGDAALSKASPFLTFIVMVALILTIVFAWVSRFYTRIHNAYLADEATRTTETIESSAETTLGTKPGHLAGESKSASVE